MVWMPDLSRSDGGALPPYSLPLPSAFRRSGPSLGVRPRSRREQHHSHSRPGTEVPVHHES
eukprot:scaffold382_cov380-Prasinococcus_capsulatus_cf.AAC.39